jgi:hypothetical protein
LIYLKIKKTGYSCNINNENNREHKRLIPLILPYIFRKKKIDEYGRDEEKFESKSFPKKSITLIKKANRHFMKKSTCSNSSNRELLNNYQNNTYNNNINDPNSLLQSIQTNCFICEKYYILSKLFSADCKRHFLCPKCIKTYYEDYLEKKK